MRPLFPTMDPVATKQVAHPSERVRPQRSSSILKTSGLSLQALLAGHEGRDSCPASGGLRSPDAESKTVCACAFL